MREMGTELRTLRESRGLSMAAVAAQTGLGRSSLLRWETGGHRPRGVGLGRLLDALQPDARLRAWLLNEADPAGARIELARSPLGAPIDVGRVVRALRLGRGATQENLARAVGATQATVARWESGDMAPSERTVRAVARALRASEEEALALAWAGGSETARMPEDPEEAHRLIWSGRDQAGPSEGFLLGAEAELWRRAARDPRWDALLCDTLGVRANHLFRQGRLGEVESVARQAIRLAVDSGNRLAATPAMGALASLARRRGDDPARMARRLEEWTARLPASGNAAWMMWVRAVRLATMGDARAAIDLTERAAEMFAATQEEALARRVRGDWLADIHLEAGDPEAAATLYAGEPAHPDSLPTYVRAEHACHRAVSERSMRRLAAMAPRLDPRGLARTMRTQARLTRR